MRIVAVDGWFSVKIVLLTGDDNVSFHKGTLAPPGEYD